jgi:hypothetical protein
MPGAQPPNEISGYFRFVHRIKVVGCIAFRDLQRESTRTGRLSFDAKLGIRQGPAPCLTSPTF